MKAMQILKVALVVLFLFGGLIGCATTPPPQADVVQSDVMSQPEVKPAVEKPMMKHDMPMHDHMAGMKKIHFDFDQFTLSAEARSILSDNAKYLKANSGTMVVIEGHCDERGSDEYNLALGESRALAAKNYLVDMGISAKRLSVISYGEEKPAEKASNETAWAKNRRAEFKSVK